MITFLMIVNGLGLPRSGLNPGYFQLGRLDFFFPQNYEKGGSLYFFLLSDIIFAEATLFLQFFLYDLYSSMFTFQRRGPIS